MVLLQNQLKIQTLENPRPSKSFKAVSNFNPAVHISSSESSTCFIKFEQKGPLTNKKFHMKIGL